MADSLSFDQHPLTAGIAKKWADQAALSPAGVQQSAANLGNLYGERPGTKYTTQALGGALGFKETPFTSSIPFSQATLRDMIGKRSSAQTEGVQTLRTLSSAAANPHRPDQNNFLKDLSLNSIGRLALLNRLEQQFGPNYRNVPAASAVLNQFENLITQEQDMESLQRMLDSSNQIYSYLTQEAAGTT